MLPRLSVFERSRNTKWLGGSWFPNKKPPKRWPLSMDSPKKSHPTKKKVQPPTKGTTTYWTRCRFQATDTVTGAFLDAGQVVSHHRWPRLHFLAGDGIPAIDSWDPLRIELAGSASNSSPTLLCGATLPPKKKVEYTRLCFVKPRSPPKKKREASVARAEQPPGLGPSQPTSTTREKPDWTPRESVQR